MRSWLDYMHFLDPGFKSSTKLRKRARLNVPAHLRAPTETAARSNELRTVLDASARELERSLPIPDGVRDAIAEEKPDAVVACPLMETRSPQVGYLRAAHELGVPAAVCVASWDNLTTSSLLHGEPDLVLVWNEAQQKEASRFHGISRERVVATGAPLYDDWFGLGPSTSPDEFRGQAGLPIGQPFVLYVCSSKFIAPDEAEWIHTWIEGVRGSGIAELEDLAVLVRPHPQHPLLDGSDAAAELERTPNLVIHPRDGALSILGSELATYYDSIHHSAAVVGINTSAMIESAIAGRGVHILLTKRYRDTQEGAPHFAHLQSAGGGLVTVRRKSKLHAADLAAAIRNEDRKQVEDRSRKFLEAFVRPHGLDQPATPLAADELEKLARSGPRETQQELARGGKGEAIADLERAFYPSKRRPAPTE